MSTTYTLVCDECKVKEDAGQGYLSSGSFYLYDTAAPFLVRHMHHHIRMLMDSAWDDDEVAYEYTQERAEYEGENVHNRHNNQPNNEI